MSPSQANPGNLEVERCGTVATVGGKDWICIRPRHDRADTEPPDPRADGGRLAPMAERHWYVRRRPELTDATR